MGRLTRFRPGEEEKLGGERFDFRRRFDSCPPDSRRRNRLTSRPNVYYVGPIECLLGTGDLKGPCGKSGGRFACFKRVVVKRAEIRGRKENCER